MRKVLIAVLALLIACALSIALLDRIGLIDISTFMVARLRTMPAFRGYIVTYELGLKQSKQLAEREAEVEDSRRLLEIQAKELKDAQAALDKQKRSLKDQQTQIDLQSQQLLRLQDTNARQDKVVKMATALSAADGARLLSGLTDEDVFRILMKLTEKQAATILAAMDPRRSAKIMTLLVR